MYIGLVVMSCNVSSVVEVQRSWVLKFKKARFLPFLSVLGLDSWPKISTSPKIYLEFVFIKRYQLFTEFDKI